EPSYEHNCLVNAMALGLGPTDRLMTSAAAGVGNVVVLFGASTGRDGIGGASVLASAELGDAEEDRRPTVQVGDPFAGKKLLECSLELLDRGLLVALQDLGAAGLTSSSAEMAAKGGVGLDLDVARVPLREADMEPFEIMISESQERMLCVVRPEQLAAVLAVCEHWQVPATPIGEVTDSGRLRVLDGGPVVADVPVGVLVDDCPLYDLAPAVPATPLYPPPERTLHSTDPGEALVALLGSPNLASRVPVFEQYDPIVQSRTVRRPARADAAVLLLDPAAGDGPAIAMAIDGNGRRVACHPRRGAAEAVYECAANLAAAGAEPLGLTNCLNFGNPEKPHVAWQLEQAVAGLAEACRELDVPVVGGNVSLYNESPDGPIYPSPIVGMVGELPEAARAGRLDFHREGDAIALVGDFRPSLGGSELAKLRGEPLAPIPAPDPVAIRAAHAAVRDAVRQGRVRSAHDVAEGGLAVALAECALAGGHGAEVDLPTPDAQRPTPDELLFGEAFGCAFLVSGDAAELHRIGTVIGRVGGDTVRIAVGGVPALERSLEELGRAFEAGVATLFSH
ncbi:MAG: phosphoribosylformylglycinamidine synthase subunit PurL, partial [Solirubrobacterales bacterium]